MRFHLHSFGPENTSNQCYFRMETEGVSAYSPIYLDRDKAFKALEKLIRRLREGGKSPRVSLVPSGEEFKLRIFGRQLPAVGTGLYFATEEEGRNVLDAWKVTARGRTYKVHFWELDEPPGKFTSLENLDLSETDRHYNWREAGSTILHLEESARIKFIPTLGLSPGLIGTPCSPLFNALSPFVSADMPLFFGRDEEVEDVYALLQQQQLLLFYGSPRVGKTSLLQCGLANRLDKETEEFHIVKTRPGEGFLPKVRSVITEAPFGKRTFLVIDQLEMLFAPQVFDAERHAFFDLLRETLARDTANLRIVLSLREAFLAPLVDYQERCPNLLENRYRLLSLRESSMIDATVDVFDVMSLQGRLKVDDSQTVAERVCRDLANENGDVPAHCLQIYLHQLHQGNCGNAEDGAVPIDSELINRMGPARNLINTFIGERLSELLERRGAQIDSPDPELEREIEELEASRLSCGCGDNKSQAVAAVAAAPVPVLAAVPWFAWLLAAALPFGLFFLYWWNVPQTSGLTACQLAEDTDTCEGYINYLCDYGDNGECAADFRTTLEGRQCEAWKDYAELQRQSTCAAYQDFFFKYRNSDLCMDFVRARLLDWSCPLVRDTVQLTVRDTIIRTLPGSGGGPAIYARNPTAPAAPPDPGCKIMSNTNFKKIGPLWVMTDALPGGPYGWEDALDACEARGWRLPCIGEIDFLIEKIYRNDPTRAYTMLTGGGACMLVNPATLPNGKIEFWTATENNDATAWSYYFDTGQRSIRSQPSTPKSARLPCLCVERDPEQKGSSLPPCYQKNIKRETSR